MNNTDKHLQSIFTDVVRTKTLLLYQNTHITHIYITRLL